MKWPNILYIDTNLHKLKENQNFLEWAWSKLGVANLVMGL